MRHRLRFLVSGTGAVTQHGTGQAFAGNRFDKAGGGRLPKGLAVQQPRKRGFGVKHIVPVECGWTLLPVAQSVSGKTFSIGSHRDKSVGAFCPKYRRQQAAEQRGRQQSDIACQGLWV